MTTTIMTERRGRAEREPDAEHLEERPARLGQTAALSRSLPDSTSGSPPT
jgi:hypothetical protein